jgi:hypothetical protein
MSQLPADEKIWEALEVCRPDRDESPDPALAQLVQELAGQPELRRRYERIRDFDAQLAGLFREVPVPRGLAEKIKSKIDPEGIVLSDGVPAETPALKSESAPSVLRWSTTVAEMGGALPRRRVVLRRWFYVAGGLSLVGAAALLIVLLAGFRKAESYTPEAVCFGAIDYFEHDRAKSGMNLQQEPLPGDFAFSRAVIQRTGIRWRKISNFLGRDGIAFDLPSPGGGRATLYSIPRSLEGACPYPITTGGCAAYAWQEDGRLFVLVVEGGKQELDGFFKPQSPLA